MINFKVSPVTDTLALCEVKRDDVLFGGIGAEIPDGWVPYLIVGPFDQADFWMRVLLVREGGRHLHHEGCSICRNCCAYWPTVYYAHKRWCPMCGTEN